MRTMARLLRNAAEADDALQDELLALLCDIEGVRLKEAAVRLGVTASAAKTRYFRAKRLPRRRPGNEPCR
jgi:hypothetical protein